METLKLDKKQDRRYSDSKARNSEKIEGQKKIFRKIKIRQNYVKKFVKKIPKIAKKFAEKQRQKYLSRDSSKIFVKKKSKIS